MEYVTENVSKLSLAIAYISSSLFWKQYLPQCYHPHTFAWPCTYARMDDSCMSDKPINIKPIRGCGKNGGAGGGKARESGFQTTWVIFFLLPASLKALASKSMFYDYRSQCRSDKVGAHTRSKTAVSCTHAIYRDHKKTDLIFLTKRRKKTMQQHQHQCA